MQRSLDGIVIIPEIACANGRNHAVFVQKVSGWSDELGPGQRQLAVIRQAQDGLHGALSIRGATDDDRSSDILKRGRDDLG